MSESVVSFEALKSFFKECRVGTAGRNFKQLQMLALFSICPDLFLEKFRITTKNHFPFKEGMRTAAK